MNYQLTTGEMILRLDDGALIPPDLQNRDYREYLEFIENGGTPEPAPDPSPPGADYLAFWDALIFTSFYAGIREQSFTSLPMNTMATELIALLGDAKVSHVHQGAIQQGIDAILAIGTFTEEQLGELQDALAAGHLEDTYTLNVP